MHGFWIAGDQRMPPGEVLALRYQTVATCGRQPFQPPDVAGGKPHAVPYSGMAVGIVDAAARSTVKQFATYVGKQSVVRTLFDQLVQAATAAPVAQAFPFRRCHLGHRLETPEWHLRVGHSPILGNPCS